MLHDQNTEMALWTAFIQGDKEAYSTLYRVYHPRLYNYGHKFTGNTALVEDCLQELLVQFWMNRSRLEAVQNHRSYLFISFRRSLLKALQASFQLPADLETSDYTFSFEASIDQVMINRERLYEQRILLNKAVDLLTSRQREAIFFMYYENMSYADIAQILNISKKACYKLVARAIAELKAIYAQERVLWTALTAFLSLSSFF